MNCKAVDMHKVPQRQRNPGREQKRCHCAGNADSIQEIGQHFRRIPCMERDQKNVDTTKMVAVGNGGYSAAGTDSRRSVVR